MFRIVARGWRIWVAAVLCAAGAACSGGGGSHDDDDRISGVSLAQAFGGRTFNAPVKLVQHPTNDNRWYVVEQGGLVKTFLDTNTTPATTAADLSAAVSDDSEQGLLGMAFDPGFDASGEVYLAYTDTSNRLVLARWVSSNADDTDFDADSVVLTIPHTPSTNHNGSDIAFGDDGFLYYSTGDGGGSDDPEDNAQRRSILLGKILRLDVNSAPPAGKTYAIPGSNPFAGNPQCNTGPGVAPCPEVFAYGFRNPWRMNFDPDTGELYVGDVGQRLQEEIDLVTSGGNFGWDCLEGELDHSALSTAPCTGPFVEPEAVYSASPSQQNAVTGGAVYRGTAISGLVGFYIFTDFFHGPFKAFDVDVPNGPVKQLSVSEDHISAFGQDRDGEIYPVDLDGQIWKVVPSSG